MGHLHLSQGDRDKIAASLSKGVTFEKILDDIRDNVDTSFSHIHLLSRKDLQNIERAFGLKGHIKHSDDATSVKAWLLEMEEKEDNPVLFYKFQGDSTKEPSLLPSDFVIVFQTEFQAEMMCKFAPNHVVCVDSTHGITGYDFKLLSMVVIDEFGEGIPVAWLLTTREDFTTVEFFFKVLKLRVGDISLCLMMPINFIKPGVLCLVATQTNYCAYGTLIVIGGQILNQ